MDTPDSQKTQQPAYDGADLDAVLEGELKVLLPQAKAATNAPAKKPATTSREATRQKLEEIDGQLDGDEADVDSDMETTEAEPKQKPVTAETEVTEEAEVEQEGAEEAEEADEEEAEVPAEEVRNPKALIARISKVKEQRNAARSERDAAVKERDTLAQQFEQVSTATMRHEPTVTEPLGDVTTEAELEQAQNYWSAELAWCRDHVAEGGTRKGADGQPVELTTEQVKARMDRALEIIQTQAPRRRELIAAQKADVAAAAKVFPFFSPNHALHKEFVTFSDGLLYASGPKGEKRLREQIASLPNYGSLLAKAFVGDLSLRGYQPVPLPDKTLKLVSMKKADPAAKKPQPATPPANARTAHPPARKATGKPQLQEAVASGDADSVLSAELGF